MATSAAGFTGAMARHPPPTVMNASTCARHVWYPRQNELAAALREVGRVERSLFMIDWTTDPDMRRRAQSGLNKGESHHALKRAINFHQRGELRDRTEEGQHYRIAGLNLLAAIISAHSGAK